MKLALVILPLIAGAACSPQEIVSMCALERVEISSDMPSWLRVDVDGAAAFWADHGVEVEVTDSPSAIPIEIEPADIAADDGDLHLAVPGCARTFKINEVLRGGVDGARCSMAHEIGHAVGMWHVDGIYSLMFEHMGVMADGSCLWSQDDEDALEAVR